VFFLCSSCVQNTTLSFEPQLVKGDATHREIYHARVKRHPLLHFRRVYLRSYCLVDNSVEILLTGGRSVFYHFQVDNQDDRSNKQNRHAHHDSGGNNNGNNSGNNSGSNGGSKRSKSKQRRDALLTLLFKHVSKKVKHWSQTPNVSSRKYFESSQITKGTHENKNLFEKILVVEIWL